jgi:type I restriction enzyme, S subunit
MNIEEFRDQNEEWIGDIPSDWSLVKIKNHFVERNVKVDDVSFPPLSVTMGGVVDQMENVSKSDDSGNRKLVKKDDFVINSRSDRKGSSGISPRDGSVSLINIVLKPKNINPKYSEYLFKSYYFKEEFFRNGRGIHFDLWSTRYELMKQVLIPYPKEEEQNHIVSYLDKKINQLDEFIEKIEQKIELHKEERNSLINEVVSKGLNPNVKTKESVVKWIDEVPTHWKIKKLKYLVKHIKEKNTPGEEDKKISPEYVESGTGICFNQYSEHSGDGYKFNPGDILLNKLRIYLKKFLLVDFEGYSIGEMIVLRTEQKDYSEFIFNCLFSDDLIRYLNSLSTGVKVPRVSPDEILSTKFPLPPIEEIIEINEFIKHSNLEVFKKISKEKRRIKLLKEYRESLISEVVTGKKRVVD